MLKRGSTKDGYNSGKCSELRIKMADKIDVKYITNHRVSSNSGFQHTLYRMITHFKESIRLKLVQPNKKERNVSLPVFRFRVPLCLFEFSHEIPLMLRELNSRRLANESTTIRHFIGGGFYVWLIINPHCGATIILKSDGELHATRPPPHTNGFSFIDMEKIMFRV